MFVEFLTIFLIFAKVDAGCDPRDDLAGGICYKFSTSKLAFQDALNACHESNQFLARVDSPATANFIATWFTAKNGRNDFWIGLSRPDTGATYQWDMGGALSWSNFDSNYPNNGLMVAESAVNGKWHTADGSDSLYYVCSYYPDASTILPSIVPRPAVTVLFMVDSQSQGIDQTAIDSYTKYFNFAIMIGDKLAKQADFSGFIDTFGYGDPNDHSYYQTLDISAFDSQSYQTTTDETDIDLDLREVDSSLQMASWGGPTHSTCLVFISAAPVNMYGGSTIKTSYPNFKTVVGATINGATIPGLTGTVAVSQFSDADAQAVVNLLLESLPH